MALSCQSQLENLITDFNTFINGAENANVTLSDGAILPSYRKYAISDLTRTGNALQNRLYFKGDIISKGTDIYVCLNDIQVSGLVLNMLYWKKIGNFDVVSGNGISAYLEYDYASNSILNSRNVVSAIVSTIDSSLITITLQDSIPVEEKIVCVASADIRNISYSLIDNPTISTNSTSTTILNSNVLTKQLSGRIISNTGNQIQVGINQGGLAALYNSSNGVYSSINEYQRNIFKPVVSFLFLTF